MTLEARPAEQLLGRELENGWTVVEEIRRDDDATGAHFSCAYKVRRDEEEAFLKALDIEQALQGPGDLVDRMAAFFDAYQFERDLLRECCNQRMSRVVQLLDDGEVVVEEAGPLGRVPYLILELADGDIHAHRARMAGIDVAWALRVLKDVSLAVEQLHRNNTAHQDIKPSNVLTQDEGSLMKLGDLGRAEKRGIETPISKMAVPGAIPYAPPEQLYGAFDHSWEMRRAGDVYLVGSLAVQLFLGHSVTALMQSKLPEGMRLQAWNGDFEGVLPYLQASHSEVSAELHAELERLIDRERVLQALTQAVREMIKPDPNQRGHPRAHSVGGSDYDVRRYVSLFNRLATEMELAMLGRL